MKHRFLALLLALCLWPAYTHAAPQETDLIRVLLTRFSGAPEISISIAGSYSVDGLYFQRGMSVSVCVGPEPEQVLLRYEGLTLVREGAITLKRHQTKEENGLRLEGSLNLYTGDLTITQRDGELRLVLSLPIEEYLLGVLPWEMSTGFPLEALKAQAVAARSYALTHRSDDRDYDVVDNTNDQVYAGISNNAAVIRRAVSETEGICVYYQGQLVTCYYSASNGGKVTTIDAVWGAGDAPTGYVVAKDDPYDLDNDESVVRQASIPQKLSANDWPELQRLLIRQAATSLKKMGYSDAPEDIELRQITAITPVTDEGAEGPKALTFALRLAAVPIHGSGEEEASFSFSGATATQTPRPTKKTDTRPAKRALDNPVEVTVPIFPELETALQLSINTASNELWSVRATKNAFVIEARRFGHGVGLSQRGAQRMAAAYGWNYKQILHFYYHDITLQKAPLTAVTPLPALSLRYDATPGPKPTATPRPTLIPVTKAVDDTVVTVNKIAVDSSLNLRREPNTASEIVTRLYYGQTLVVLPGDVPSGWLRVRTDAAEGYVMEKYVTKVRNQAR